MESAHPKTWKDRTARLARWLVPLLFFAVAMWVLLDSMRGFEYAHIAGALHALRPARMAWAAALTAGGYLVLAGYDVLAFRYVGRKMRLREMGLASFVSNALGNNVGGIVVSSAAVRFWMYTSLGIPAADVTKVVVFCALGFWLGFLTLGALWFILTPSALPAGWDLPWATTAPLGWALLGLLGLYVALVVRRRPLAFRSFRLALPSPALTAAQAGVASLDLCLMGTALYVLLPASPEFSYPHFMGVFLLELVLSSASQVPGGLGVFESVVLLHSPAAARPGVAAALLAFRALYFILPLFVAAGWLGVRELRRHLPRLPGLLKHSGRWASATIPPLLAAAVYVAGAVLLFSGAVPAAAGRLAELQRFVSLPVIETSHFVASLIGTALLLVAHAVQRRMNAAYYAAIVLLAAGSGLSLAKGWDYEEALALALTLALLLPFRNHFYRQAALLAEPFTAGWSAAALVILGGSALLAAFAYAHPEFAGAPWWRFSLHDEASRSLRAVVGAAILAIVFALIKLLGPASPRPRLPDDADLARARPIIERSGRTYPNLAYRRDKALLFNRAGTAFLMYGRMGRSWIAMGDPVGPAREARELLWQFRDLCDRFDAWPVFFEIRPAHLGWYADLGLATTQLGEEACVDLQGFDLERPGFARLRQARAKLERAGWRFELLPRERVAAVLPELMRVSDRWLARKATREKGFSNASFDPAYLAYFPVAVVRGPGGIVAFANLWQGATKEELSVDLMRHLPEAPHGTMDYLFCSLFEWGRREGYRYFNFGMAPLSGLAARPDVEGRAPLWNRVGTFVFRHGEHFYNFRGLREYKDKFHPVWTPLYLASPGGVALPAVLLDVTALIAGGYGGIVSKRPARARAAA